MLIEIGLIMAYDGSKVADNDLHVVDNDWSWAMAELGDRKSLVMVEKMMVMADNGPKMAEIGSKVVDNGWWWAKSLAELGLKVVDNSPSAQHQSLPAQVKSRGVSMPTVLSTLVSLDTKVLLKLGAPMPTTQEYHG